MSVLRHDQKDQDSLNGVRGYPASFNNSALSWLFLSQFLAWLAALLALSLELALGFDQKNCPQNTGSTLPGRQRLRGHYYGIQDGEYLQFLNGCSARVVMCKEILYQLLFLLSLQGGQDIFHNFNIATTIYSAHKIYLQVLLNRAL